MKRKPRIYLFVTTAMICGLAAIPVAAFVNIFAGLVLLSLPVLLVYKAG
ncbi:MAG: hypothetical protein PVJ39_16675 [Gammaproteobacteria bacterium]